MGGILPQQKIISYIPLTLPEPLTKNQLKNHTHLLFLQALHMLQNDLVFNCRSNGYAKRPKSIQSRLIIDPKTIQRDGQTDRQRDSMGLIRPYQR